ncbi:MAG: hypothetical protein ACKOT0_04740 [bacterium]
MRTSSRIVAAVGAAALASVLAGCGLGKQAVEQAAENAAEQQLGEGSDVEIGEDGSVKIESSDGAVEVGTGNLPAGWPTSVPAVPGLSLVSSYGADGSFGATWQGEGDQRATAEAYVDALRANGFSDDPDYTAPLPDVWFLVGNGLKVNVLASESGGTTAVVVTATPDTP